MRYTMGMTGKNDRLLQAILAGVGSSAKMTKSAGPAIVTDDIGPSEYTQSVRHTQIAQQKERDERQRKLTQPKGPSNNPYYNNQPYVKEMEHQKELERINEEWSRAQKGNTQHQSIDDTKAQIDREEAERAEADRQGTFGSWLRHLGDSTLNGVSKALAYTGDGIGQYVSWALDAPSGTSLSDWKDQWVKNNGQHGIDDLAADIRNNFRLQGNAIGNGLDQTLRFAGKWIDPNSWGSSEQAKLNRWAHDNASQNAYDRFHERQSRVFDQFKDENLKDLNSAIGQWNYGLNTAVGEFTGGEIATAGIGATAKLGGRAIKGSTKFLGNQAGRAVVRGGALLGKTHTAQALSGLASRVGNTAPMQFMGRQATKLGNGYNYWRSGFGSIGKNLEASRLKHIEALTRAGGNPNNIAALRSSEAFRQAYVAGLRGNPAAVSRWMQQAGRTYTMPVHGWQRVGNAVNRGIQEVGNTLAMPFDVVGTMATPVSSLGKNKSIQAAFSPIQRFADRAMYTVRHPVNSYRYWAVPGARNAWNSTKSWMQYARVHPYRATGRALYALGRTGAYPIRYGYNIAKPALADTLKAGLGMPGFRAMSLYGVGSNMTPNNRSYGRAAASLLPNASWAAMGWKSIPVEMAAGYLGFGGEEDPYQ